MNSYTLITGGSKDIGFSLARKFAQNGYSLILVAGSPAELEEAAGALSANNVEVVTIAKDLFNKDAALELYNDVVDRELKVDILANNAG